MSSFRFERLIEVKEKLREHKQRELETALGQARSLEEEAAAVEREIVAHYDRMTGRCITGDEFSLVVGGLAYLDGRKAAVAREREKKDALIAALRTALMALLLELKMFGKLKLKALQAARKAASRKEQKLMDAVGGRVADRAGRASRP